MNNPAEKQEVEDTSQNFAAEPREESVEIELEQDTQEETENSAPNKKLLQSPKKSPFQRQKSVLIGLQSFVERRKEENKTLLNTLKRSRKRPMN